MQGTDPQELIHRLCTATETVIRDLGADLPQPAVAALVENLVHAGFMCATVTVLDAGRTVRVADRGRGIPDKRRALEPGYSSAGPAERSVIRGVGSGLAVAARLAAERGGSLEINDNLGGGTVVTLTVAGGSRQTEEARVGPILAQLTHPARPARSSELTDDGKRVLLLLAELGGAGLPTICAELRIDGRAARGELDELRHLGLHRGRRDQGHQQ